MQPDTSTFTPAAARHQPTPNSAPRTEWPSEPPALFDPQLHSLYLCHCPIDMRLGFDGVLARVIHWFGSARPHCAYAFTNARGNRIKLLIHDGLGLWLVQRRLHSGRFAWIEQPLGVPVSLSTAQWRALSQGLPWSRIDQAITAH